MKRAIACVLVLVAFATSTATRKARATTPADAYPESQDDKFGEASVDDTSLGDMEEKAEAAHAQIAKLHGRMAAAEESHANLQDELQGLDSDFKSDETVTKKEEQPAQSDDGAPPPDDLEQKDAGPAQGKAEQEIQDGVKRLESEVPSDKPDPGPPPLVNAAASDSGADSADAGEKPSAADSNDGLEAPKFTDVAGGSDDGFDATEKSLAMFHQRYAKERKTTKHLREELQKAVDWGKGLQKRLRGNLKAFKEQGEENKQVLAKLEHKQAAAMNTEKKREHVLESMYNKENRTLVARNQHLLEVEQELNATKRERATLSASALRALRAERKQEAKLQAELSKSQGSARDLKSKLEHSTSALSVARTEWRAEEMRLLKSQQSEQKANNQLEANLSRMMEQVKNMRNAKHQEDEAFKTFTGKSQQVLKDAQGKLVAARGRELTLRKALDRDHKKREIVEVTLQKELAVWKKRADNAQASAQQLSREVQLRAAGDREEVAELRKKLDAETREAKHLEAERNGLDRAVRGNATRSQQLQSEVMRLRQQVKNGEVARRKADAAAKRAQEETASAQAVAKQLSGTVPRLLEQAQLAHERRDAIVALRAQKDAQGAMSESVKEENRTVSSNSSDYLVQAVVEEDDDKPAVQNATAATTQTDGVSTLLDETEVQSADSSGDSADAVVQKLQDEVESGPKSTDLAGDSAGLTQLLDED